MEECEALCTKIAIMVNGQFKCLGSIQHLKSRFGEGYTLIARVSAMLQASALPPVQPLMDYISHCFPGSVLKDVHQGMVHYHITDTGVSLADLFGKMERAKKKYRVEDYLISQTTLEQVFINFVQSQTPPMETPSGCCSVLRGLCCCQCCNGGEQQEEPIYPVEQPSSSSSAQA